MLVQLDNVNAGGEAVFFWQILDQPPGTAVTLSNANIQNPTFTPTKEGTYLLSLTVNGTITSKIVAAVLQLKSLQRIPAAGETTEADASDGWATDVDDTLLALLNSQADPGTLVGVAGSTGCDAGTVLFLSGRSVLKSGLPGEEIVPTFTLADYSATAAFKVYTRREPLYMGLGGVDGDTTPASGAIIRVRAFGLQEFAVGGAAVGDVIYTNRDGLLSTSRDLIPRQVGIQASATHVLFDGRYVSNAALDLYDTLLTNVPVGDANMSRIASRSNMLQVSENGGAFAPIGLADAPFLLNGASARYTSAVNIQALASALVFIASHVNGKVAVRRLNGGDTGTKFAIQNEAGADILTLSGAGGGFFTSVSSSGAIEAAGTIESLGGDFVGTGNCQVDGNVICTDVSANGNVVANGNVTGADVTATNNIAAGGDVSGSSATIAGLTYSQNATITGILEGDNTCTSTGFVDPDGSDDGALATVGYSKFATLQYQFYEGGSVITTGVKAYLEIPFDCTITRVTMLADQSGSIVVDIWKDTYANYPPTVLDTITAAAKPTISAAIKSQDSTLTGWTLTLARGDILAFKVDSATTVTNVTMSLSVRRT